MSDHVFSFIPKRGFLSSQISGILEGVLCPELDSLGTAGMLSPLVLHLCDTVSGIDYISGCALGFTVPE